MDRVRFRPTTIDNIDDGRCRSVRGRGRGSRSTGGGDVCEEHRVALDVVAIVRVSAQATYDVSTRTHSSHIVIVEAVGGIGVGIARVSLKACIRARFNRRMVRQTARVTI